MSSLKNMYLWIVSLAEEIISSDHVFRGKGRLLTNSQDLEDISFQIASPGLHFMCVEGDVGKHTVLQIRNASKGDGDIHLILQANVLNEIICSTEEEFLKNFKAKQTSTSVSSSFSNSSSSSSSSLMSLDFEPGTIPEALSFKEDVTLLSNDKKEPKWVDLHQLKIDHEPWKCIVRVVYVSPRKDYKDKIAANRTNCMKNVEMCDGNGNTIRGTLWGQQNLEAFDEYLQVGMLLLLEDLKLEKVREYDLKFNSHVTQKQVTLSFHANYIEEKRIQVYSESGPFADSPGKRNIEILYAGQEPTSKCFSYLSDFSDLRERFDKRVDVMAVILYVSPLLTFNANFCKRNVVLMDRNRDIFVMELLNEEAKAYTAEQLGYIVNEEKTDYSMEEAMLRQTYFAGDPSSVTQESNNSDMEPQSKRLRPNEEVRGSLSFRKTLWDRIKNMNIIPPLPSMKETMFIPTEPIQDSSSYFQPCRLYGTVTEFNGKNGIMYTTMITKNIGAQRESENIFGEELKKVLFVCEKEYTNYPAPFVCWLDVVSASIDRVTVQHLFKEDIESTASVVAEKGKTYMMDAKSLMEIGGLYISEP